MIELSANELEQTNGGISIWAIAGGIALVVFAIGVVDGYVNPGKCD